MQTIPGYRSLKEKQRQEREALILQVAQEVLLEKGYFDTSIDEIAARVGIAKGTVYLHFPSKEDLVVAIFKHDMHLFLQQFEEAIAAEQTPRAKLEALMRFLFVGIYSKHAALLSTIFNSVDLSRLFAEKKNCMYELWEDVVKRVRVLLEEGKACGEFDATIPTDVMVSTFLNLLLPRSYSQFIREEDVSTDELVSYVSRIYFKGVAAH